MGLNLFCKSTVCQVLMQTFKGFYECTKQPADLGAGWCDGGIINYSSSSSTGACLR